MEAQAIAEQDRNYRKCSFPLPDGQQLVLTIYGDIVYGDDAEGWSAVDIRVFDSDGKQGKTLALVMYRHARGEPPAVGEFSDDLRRRTGVAEVQAMKRMGGIQTMGK